MCKCVSHGLKIPFKRITSHAKFSRKLNQMCVQLFLSHIAREKQEYFTFNKTTDNAIFDAKQKRQHNELKGVTNCFTEILIQ